MPFHQVPLLVASLEDILLTATTGQLQVVAAHKLESSSSKGHSLAPSLLQLPQCR